MSPCGNYSNDDMVVQSSDGIPGYVDVSTVGIRVLSGMLLACSFKSSR